ncbi:MAG: Uma2 family endonuclease, partial [Dehalococcoidia bacterium]|nr:Uma2 family endonuclease [Dehalococcoidia bacterium]
FTDGANYRLPDVSYWSSPSRPANDSVPTLAIEVRSPGQTMGELREKCRFFRRNGVQVAWLADLESRTVEVFEEERDAEALTAPAVLTSLALPGFALDLAGLFGVLGS